MTEKLYYGDSGLRRFDASVLSCEARDGRFEIVPDRTAFFPGGGGQPADLGSLSASRYRMSLNAAGTSST
jgi:Ser-tRNA(Ala) deacylase AlaX